MGRIEEAGKSQDRPNPISVGRPSAGAKNVLRLESRHNKFFLNQTTPPSVFFSRPKKGLSVSVRQIGRGPVLGDLFGEESQKKSEFLNRLLCEFCVS